MRIMIESLIELRQQGSTLEQMRDPDDSIVSAIIAIHNKINDDICSYVSKVLVK